MASGTSPYQAHGHFAYVREHDLHSDILLANYATMPELNETTNDQSVDLETDYANNTFFESSVWDLKLIFGEFTGRTNSVDWHTSITVPWAQAKLMAYYLNLNIAFHELNQGPIPIPSPVLPQPPQLPEHEKNNPISIAQFEYATRFRSKFLESLGKPPSV